MSGDCGTNVHEGGGELERSVAVFAAMPRIAVVMAVQGEEEGKEEGKEEEWSLVGVQLMIDEYLSIQRGMDSFNPMH